MRLMTIERGLVEKEMRGPDRFASGGLAAPNLETNRENTKGKRTMKTIIKIVLCLQMTALLLTTALSDPTTVEQGVPFRGDLEGSETQEFEFVDGAPTGFRVEGSGTGDATHFGRLTVTWEFDAVIDPATGNVSAIGSRRFVAENGDLLVTEATAAGTPPDEDGIASIRETNVIMTEEGTGRFAGASGSFIVERLAKVGPGGANDTSGSFDGTILLNLPTAPFRGDVEGSETQAFEFVDGMPTGFRVEGSGTGHATHFGRLTVTWEFDAVIDPATGNVSANGGQVCGS